MSEIIDRPTGGDPLNGFTGIGHDASTQNGLEQDELADVAALLNHTSMSFSEVPYQSPHEQGIQFEEVISHSILSRDSLKGKTTPLSDFRSAVGQILDTFGFSAEAQYDAKLALTEVVSNVRLHGRGQNGSPSQTRRQEVKQATDQPQEKPEEYIGECRLLAARVIGEHTVRTTVVIETVNYAYNPESSMQERERERSGDIVAAGGRGLFTIQALAQEHGGQIGRYRVVHGEDNQEYFVPEEVCFGAWAVWAALTHESPRQELAALQNEQ